MASDRDLVSSEDHEMNYLLEKWGKKRSKANREDLVGVLKKFKKDPDYKPHNRENFYKYVNDKNIIKSLEEAGKKPITKAKETNNKAKEKSTGSNPVKKSSNSNYKDFLNNVRLRAYYNYLERVKDNKIGDEISDWLNAEKAVNSKK